MASPVIPVAAARAGRNNPQNPVNVLQPTVPQVYLRLRFQDPNGVVRDFPTGLPVKVVFGTYTHICNTNQRGQVKGYLNFPAKLELSGMDKVRLFTTDWWDKFTLVWDNQILAEPYYIVCEERGAAAQTCELASESTLETVATGKKRFFRLPRATWSLKNGDWNAQGFSGNGSFVNGEFRQSTAGTPKDIGIRDAPVHLVLNPHWKFLQFVFFDRYWGPIRTGSPAPPTHGGPGNKVGVPPLELKGFRDDANANTNSNPPAAAYFSHSNWTEPHPSDTKRLLQCLPWIKQFDDNHAALTPDLTGQRMGLLFETKADSYVYSKSDTEREIVTGVASGDARLKLGPDRLKYYDLPRTWRSRMYYARIGAGGKFFGKLTKADIDNAEVKANSITFSLDDIVLYQNQPARQVVPLGARDKVVLFHHRMNQKLTGVEKWIHEPADAADPPDAKELPYSKVVVPNGTDAQEPRSYIYDYPDWTRVVIAQGSLFDTFDQRTPDAAANATLVTGARAAMRWINETAPFATGSVLDSTTLGLAADRRPIPGNIMFPGPDREDFPASGEKHFQTQPFFQVMVPQRYQARFNPSNIRKEAIGRFSLALLRCCDVEGTDEVAINLHYLKSYFNFAYPPPAGASACTLGDDAQKDYARKASLNVAARWNGVDAQNDSRTELLPQNVSPPVPLKVYVTWYCQSVPEPRAHCSVGIVGGDGRDNRGTWGGTGESNELGHTSGGTSANAYWFPIAHESGHMAALSDDYNERWWGNSYNQISFKANVPGDPYEADGRTYNSTGADSGIMNGNSRMRNRYFWVAAEWTRVAIEGTHPNIRFKVKHKDMSGVVYDDYSLKPLMSASNRRTYLNWPIESRLGPIVVVVEPAARPAIASPPSPPLASPPPLPPLPSDQFDLFLYQLGKDHYSSYLLQNAAGKLLIPAARVPFDGILVVAIRLKCNLPADPSPDSEKTTRQQITALIAAWSELRMHRKWYVKGDHGMGPNQIQFRRCLLHFVPQLLVNNHPHYVPTSPPASDAPTTLATNLENTFGFNYFLKIAKAGSPPQPTAWDMATRSLFLDYTNLRDLIIALDDEFPKFLGVNKAISGLVDTDWKPLVEKVLSNVTVHSL